VEIRVETNELVCALVEAAAPVRRLRAPWRRTVLWLALSLAYVVTVTAVHRVLGDGVGPIDLRILIEQAAILATAITAAVAAFSSTVPGRDRRLCLLPLVPLAVWLASLGEGCVQDWMNLGAGGIALRADWDCAPAAVILSVVPAVVMVAMLRRGAPLLPRLSVALGALAVAALVNFGLRVFHAGDVSIMVLAWHFGGVALLSLVAGHFGRAVLNWHALLVAGNLAAIGAHAPRGW
jgi:hypothetical protein